MSANNLPTKSAKKKRPHRQLQQIWHYSQLATVVAGICATWATANAADGFQSLGLLNGGSYSEAYGVSADGSVVVGESTDSTAKRRAFRWTAAGGMQPLGLLT